MKKKLAAMILTLALAAGVMAPVPAYADGITVEETSMDTATEKSFDTDYPVKWDAGFCCGWIESTKILIF